MDQAAAPPARKPFHVVWKQFGWLVQQ